MLKYLGYAFIAGFLDLLQLGITVAFAFIGAFSGTLGGAGGGAYLGWKICSDFNGTILTACTSAGAAVGGIIGSFLDPVLAPWATEVAAVLGLILNAIISMSIGTAFIFLLTLGGLVDRKTIGIVVPFYIAKIIPFSDAGPFWSLMVGRLILKERLGSALNIKQIAKDAVKGAVEGSETGPEGMVAGAALAVAKGTTTRVLKGDVREKPFIPSRSSPSHADQTKKLAA